MIVYNIPVFNVWGDHARAGQMPINGKAVEVFEYPPTAQSRCVLLLASLTHCLPTNLAGSCLSLLSQPSTGTS